MGERNHWNGRHVTVVDLDGLVEDIKADGVVPGSARFNFTINAVIIRHFLGDDWFRDHMHPEYAHPTSYLRPDFSASEVDPKFSLQSLALAEMLFNLQYVGGFRERLEQLALRQLEAGLAELQIGQVLKSRGVPFRFVEPREPTTVDIVFRLPCGSEALGEVKCKEEETAYSDRTLARALARARKQIGEDNAGVAFVKVPVSWVDVDQEHPTGPARITLPPPIVATARDAMRKSKRIKKVIFYIVHYGYDSARGLGVTDVTMEMTNARETDGSPWSADLLGDYRPSEWTRMLELSQRWA
jgi:hypothetical protein